MKTIRHYRPHLPLVALVVVGLMLPTSAFGFDFDLGSDGSYGPINVTTDTTIPLPADGVIHATTVDVAPGATLTFMKNAANTPVVLLATGDINIGGTIDVSGQDAVGSAGAASGPGGTDGGSGVLDADMLAQHAWQLAYASIDRPSYLYGGVGGRGSYGNSICTSPGGGGGGGGGGLVVISNTAIHATDASATILARGGYHDATLPTCSAGGTRFIAKDGEGGKVMLVAPTADLGNLTIDTGTGQSWIDFIVGAPPTVVSSYSNIGTTMRVWEHPLTLVEIVSVDGVPVGASHSVQLTGAGRTIDIEVHVVGCTNSLLAGVTSLDGTGWSASLPAATGDDTVTVQTHILSPGTTYALRPEALCEP